MFKHHPDGRIHVNASVYPIAFWAAVEPNYNIGSYIGREYMPGEYQHLIRAGNRDYDRGSRLDAELDGYIYRQSEYDAAFASWQNGAFVENVGGVISVYGPPVISVDVNQIEADGVDSVVVTVDVGDVGATDVIDWECIAPDGSTIVEAANLVAGLDSWELTTSHVGVHVVNVIVENWGSCSIVFEGV